MARQIISTGTGPNTGTGDSNYTSWTKTNRNFMELYMLDENGNTVTPPVTPAGAPGDYKGKTTHDGSFFYICVQDYTDGTTDIWRRTAVNVW